MVGATDFGLVIAALGLSLIGAVLVYSATRHSLGSSALARHLFNTAVGVALFVLVSRVDLRVVRAWAPWVYAASVLGLLAVLSPLGTTINGSRSWLVLPLGFSLQPSELMKPALCVGLAMLLAEGADRSRPPSNRDVLLATVLAGVPVALVLLQPDLGSAVVLAALAAGVIGVSGAPKRWLAAAALLAAGAVTLALTTPLLSPYQRDRLVAFLDPSADPQGIGYQTRQVRAAIGSGGWTGQGLFQGERTQSGAIPFQQTDFVFSVAGEELGFVGAVMVLLLLAFLVLRALVVAIGAPEPFDRLVALGVACWFAFQVFENVGMNLGLTPVTGVPLPFLSYGGSSMFACWVAVGLVNRAGRRFRAN